jgi:hypothetical protein
MVKKYKTSEILRKSLKYLWDGKILPELHRGKELYVCFAIKATRMQGNADIREEISKRLGGPNTTIMTWLYDKHNIHTSSYVATQDYRRRWVLSMIEEFEAKGD